MGSLADMTLAAQQRCDRVNASTIVPTEWTAMVNASVQELYGVLTSTYQDYNIKRYPFTLVGGAGQNSILVGAGNQVADFYRPRGMWRQMGTTGWATLLRLSTFLERNQYVGPMVDPLYGQIPQCWDLMGNVLEVLPDTSSAGNYLLTYVPQMPKLVNAADTIDAYWLTVNGWDEYVIVDVAAKALIKEESLDTAALLLQQKEQIRQRILREAAPRDDSQPGHIADVRRVRSNYGYGNSGRGFGW